MEKRTHVRTAHGCGSVQLKFLDEGQIVGFATEAHILVKDGEPLRIPTGVAYVRNADLAKRTNGKRTHMLVRGGLFDTLRLSRHVTFGSAKELGEMHRTRQDVHYTADALLVSDRLPGEQSRMILNHLGLIESALMPPKRNDDKLAAGERIAKARGLRASGDGRKIAPAAVVAQHATRDLDRRMKGLRGIRRTYAIILAAVWKTIVHYKDTVDGAWEFLAEPEDLHRSIGISVMWGLMQGCANPEKAAANRDMLRRRFIEHAMRLEGLTFRPYREQAIRAARCLRKAADHARYDNLPAAQAEARNARRHLRCVRIVEFLDEKIIGRLSRYAQKPARKWNPEDIEQVDIRRRFAEVAEYIRGISDDDLDAKLLESLREHLGIAERELAAGSVSSVHRSIKAMAAALTPMPRKKAEQAISAAS